MAKKKSTKKRKKKVEKSSSFNLKKRWTDFWANRSPALRFFGLFLLGMAAFYALYFSPFFAKTVHPPILNFQANIGSFLIGLTGIATDVAGSVIKGKEFSMDISGGCDGLEVTAILVAGILAFPSLWTSKFKGLGFGILALAVLNMLRYPVLYYAGAFGSANLFDFLHIQGGFIIFVSITIIIWGIWANWAMQAEKAALEQA